MANYRVSFVGNPDVYDIFSVRDQVGAIIRELIAAKGHVEFYSARSSASMFDILVASEILKAKEELGWDKCSSILVLQHPKKEEKPYGSCYDDVLYPSEVKNASYGYAATKRNEWFVKNTDMLVAYVVKETGGAALCLKKAMKRGIEIRRIAVE